MYKFFVFFVFFCFFFVFAGLSSFAQDTLPKLTVKNINKKIIISWKSNYGGNIANINIQRSSDSLKNFSTIGSVLEPMNKENGYIDIKPPGLNMFYRVFVAFEGGTYVFTKSYRPAIDTISVMASSTFFHDMPFVKTDSIKLKVTAPIKGFVSSKFIFMGKDNNVVVSLPTALTHQYSVKFFDEKDRQVFEVSKMIEPYFIIEKVNFLHSGWFYFKLYNKGELVEKNQFYIPKEGRVGIPPSEINKKF